jgi:hypothetical protein
MLNIKPSQAIIIAAAALIIVMSLWVVAVSRTNSDANMTDSGVIMTIQKVTPSNISFTLENPTKNEYIYGDNCALYVRKNNSWERIEPVGKYNDTRRTLAPLSKTNVITNNLHWMFGELFEGDYKFQ